MCPNAGGLTHDRDAAQRGRADSGGGARAKRILIAGLSLAIGACLPEHDLSSYSAGPARSATQPAPDDEQPAAVPAPGTQDPSPAAAPPDERLLDAGAAVGTAGLLPGSLLDRPGDDACPPSCEANPGAFRGKSAQSLQVAGLERSFIYYAPERLAPDLPAPILIVAHGFSVSADELFAITGFDTLADREGFLLVFPNGQGVAPWNIGAGSCPSTVGGIPSASGDDQAFIDAILTFIESDRALDREHVFVGGLASGGYFASETACNRSDIRGIASHSGGSRSLADCSAKALPVIVFHGVLDDVVPVACGVETRQRWAEHNACDGSVDVRAVLGGACEYSRGCAPDGQVVLCLFDELGRDWAGGVAPNGMNAGARFASAAELTWEFFREFAW